MELNPFSHLGEKLSGFVIGTALLLLLSLLTLDCRPKPPPPPTRTLLYAHPWSVSYVRSQRGRNATQPDLFKPIAWPLLHK